MRFLSGNYGSITKFKVKDVHNQSCCLLKEWELHEEDKARVEASQDPCIILEKLPKRLAVLVSRKDEETQLEDKPNNYVWIPVDNTLYTSVDLSLYSDSVMWILVCGDPVSMLRSEKQA